MSAIARAWRFLHSFWVAMSAKGNAMWREDANDDAFVPIESEVALASWLERPGPTLVLLHDPYCPISRAAQRDVSRLAEPIALIDVAAAPELSEVIEERTGIRHESPQIILLRDGAPVWSASHYRVTESGVTDAIAKTGTDEAAIDSVVD